MRKLKTLAIILVIFSSCSDNEICNENCYEVYLSGNLGAFLVNECTGKNIEYVYDKNDKKNRKHLYVGQTYCDLNEDNIY